MKVFEPETVKEPVITTLPENVLDPVVAKDPVWLLVITGFPLLVIEPVTENDPVDENDPDRSSEPDKVGIVFYVLNG
jgi:hypothetical protein